MIFFFCAVNAMIVALSHASDLEIGVRIIFNEGRSVGLGNPCSPKEREMIKTAFRKAASGGETIHRDDRQLLSCSYLCEEYDTGICYLAHPHCAAPRKEDELDHHDEPNYLDPVGLQKFQSEHILFEDICDMTFSSLEEKQKCDSQQTAIQKMIQEWLVPHLSDTCNHLVENSIGLTCFRL